MIYRLHITTTSTITTQFLGEEEGMVVRKSPYTYSWDKKGERQKSIPQLFQKLLINRKGCLNFCLNIVSSIETVKERV